MNPNEIKVGEIITTKAKRDAIHVAIAPVVAGEELEPGTHVAFEADGRVVSYRNNPIGVVDPFLEFPVKEGETFWLFMYPRTAKNLRHDWDHPAFVSAPIPMSVSELWLRDYAEKCERSYGDLMSGVEEYIKSGCSDATMEDNFREFDVPDEFWVHYKNVTGLDGHGDFWGCCI